MKHFILVIALFAASNFAAVAQSLTLGDGNEISFCDFRTIPGCWTSTGKSYITEIVDVEEEINIYSLNGECVANFSNPYSKIVTQKKFYTDSFKIVVKINWEDERLFEYWKGVDFDRQRVCYEKDSTGIEGAKALLDSIYSDNYKWVIFTDASGREGIYDENDLADYGFYNEEEFGHKYPRGYYTFLGDNLLYFMWVDYTSETVLDEENATWTEDEDGSYYTSNIGTCYYYDITLTDFIEGKYLSFTQTLYNDDDKWEYWIKEFDVKEGSHYDWYSSVDAKYYRKCYYENTVKKYVLMNSDGEKLCEIPVAKRDLESYSYYGSDLLLLKDEDGYYIALEEYYEGETYTSFLTTYKFDRKTNQITKVSERKNRLDVSGAAAVKGERLKISVDDGKAGESVVISDMSGRVVSTADAKEEGTYINTGGMASGIYNVTLQSKTGKENKRIVIR